MRRVPVVTPKGTFHSISDAAVKHGMATATMFQLIYSKAEGFRRATKKEAKLLSPKSWRKRPLAERGVTTPFGKFSTIRDAAKAHRITSALVVNRCYHQNYGFRFVGDTKPRKDGFGRSRGRPKKPVITPMGWFSCAEEAAVATDRSLSSIYYHIAAEKPGWAYA